MRFNIFHKVAFYATCIFEHGKVPKLADGRKNQHHHDGGRPRNDLQPGLRIVPFEKRAVIADLIEAGCVRIANIFYGGRDYEALYRSGGDAG